MPLLFVEPFSLPSTHSPCTYACFSSFVCFVFFTNLRLMYKLLHLVISSFLFISNVFNLVVVYANHTDSYVVDP